MLVVAGLPGLFCWFNKGGQPKTARKAVEGRLLLWVWKVFKHQARDIRIKHQAIKPLG